MVVMQRFGRGLVVEPYLANIILAGGVLKRAGSTAQKQQWLQPIIGGELQATLAFTEPQARYDLADITTSAASSGESWVLNGRKGFVLNGGTAELIIVPARTAGEQRDREGISLFAVPADAAGVSCNAYRSVDGLRAAELNLDNVEVDSNGVLGELGSGFAVLDATIDDATLAICAEAVGIMRVLTDKTVEYSKSRSQFGVPDRQLPGPAASYGRHVDCLRAERSRCCSGRRWLNAAGGDDAKRADQLDQVPGRHQRRRKSAKRPCSCTAAWASPGNSTLRTTSND